MELLPVPQQRLKDQVAIVTGASRGIGKATAIALATEGAKVMINYARSSDAAEALAAEITKAGGAAIALQADVSQVDQVDALKRPSKNGDKSTSSLITQASPKTPC